MPLGIYISVPFCKSKCSYCNFATGVVSKSAYARYVDRVCSDVAGAKATAQSIGGVYSGEVNTVFLGGGTPTILEPADLERLFRAVRENFQVAPNAEITVECAPGTLTPPHLEVLLRCGVNRVSLGVQSWVDAEAAAVGRLHTRAGVLEDVAALRAAGVDDINVDLIAGLPHQTPESWEFSIQEAIAIGVPHISVYMLEVDEDSRLGRELMAGGTKYHAHFVPNEDLTAEFYTEACRRLDDAGIRQYEISNFARAGRESRHNLKYWERQPYFGFGVDAHSMLLASSRAAAAVRFATADDTKSWLAGAPVEVHDVSPAAALEEALFLGLRLNRGVAEQDLVAEFGSAAMAEIRPVVDELIDYELLERWQAQERNGIRLTARGRLLSNEVFAKFLDLGVAACADPT